jgi:hypothetical protein
LLVLIAEAVNTAATLEDPRCLVRLTRLLVATDGLCLDLVFNDFTNNRAWVANIDAEELLTHRHDADTGATGEANVQRWVEKLLVAVQERIVKCNAALIRVQGRVLVLLLKLIVILGKDET